MLLTAATSTGIRRNQDPEGMEIFLVGYSCTFMRVSGPLPSSISFFVLPLALNMDAVVEVPRGAGQWAMRVQFMKALRKSKAWRDGIKSSHSGP